MCLGSGVYRLLGTPYLQPTICDSRERGDVGHILRTPFPTVAGGFVHASRLIRRCTHIGQGSQALLGAERSAPRKAWGRAR